MDDHKLIQLFQATGKKEYFEPLFDKYIDISYRKCLSYLGNTEDTEDAAQEIWTKVYFSLPSFRAESAFSTWLYRICVNHCINVLKKRKSFVSMDELKISGFEQYDEKIDIEINISNQEDVTKVLFILSKDKELFLMKYVEGYTYEEISQVFGIGVSALKMRIARAKKKLLNEFQ